MIEGLVALLVDGGGNCVCIEGVLMMACRGGGR